MKQPSQNFENLHGMKIHQWIGTEMAVDIGPPVVWTDDSIKYLQLFDLDIHFSDNTLEHFVSRLDEDCNYYGFHKEQAESPLVSIDAEDSDFLRIRTLPELPVGVIDQVEYDQDDHKQITALTIYVESRAVKLWSGFIDCVDDQFKIIKPEDFILIKVEEVYPGFYSGAQKAAPAEKQR